MSPFDEGLPAVDNLDAELRSAVQAAAVVAAADGQLMVITSGWRSGRRRYGRSARGPRGP
ncbi:hypothetical protein FHX48_000608 [Microbacterium halimionae]|uniref:Uncharacterized protein n=1 Tax=Microbacterium halimionae TaxID=1526413 RepID=A0A7W3JME5_9MICO|nr:hypothetical protein [Microbacterium halimionae]MBA8815556.1 hypothetical protein [Microbacterium halimionae]